MDPADEQHRRPGPEGPVADPPAAPSVGPPFDPQLADEVLQHAVDEHLHEALHDLDKQPENGDDTTERDEARPRFVAATPDDHGERAGSARRWAKPSKLVLTATFTPLVLFTIGNYIASALLPTLLARHPGWLIALDPRTRNLVLVTAQMSVWTYFGLAVVRRMLPHPLWFMVGRWYGDAGVRWIEKRSPDVGAMITTMEGWFPRWGWLLCILFPHPLVCVLAGASSMGFAAFIAYNIVGIVGFVWAARAFGEVVESPLKHVTGFVSDYSIPLTIASVVLVAIYAINGQRNGRSRIEGVEQMEEELEAELHRPSSAPKKDDRPSAE